MRMFEVEFDSGYTVVLFAADTGGAIIAAKKCSAGPIVRITEIVVK
jgi:hypothetical protein